MDEIVICPKCKGFGFVEHDIGTHKSEYITEVCKKCKGSGRLEKTVTTEYKPFVPGRAKAEREF